MIFVFVFLQTVRYFVLSLVISLQFLTISALENNSWASVLKAFKEPFLPMAWQNRIAAGTMGGWPSVLEHKLVHNRAVALNLVNPSGALARLTELA